MSQEHVNELEKRLVEGCLKGDRRAQRILYETFSPKMFPICLRYMGDRETARDVLQDGFITVFEKIGSYKGDGSFEGWMRRIFVNTALMQIRKNDALRFSEEIEGVPLADMGVNSYGVIERMSADELMELVMSMPAGFRMVFNLSVIEGFDHSEISRMLGISEGASRSQLSRGRQWLQDKLKKNR